MFQTTNQDINTPQETLVEYWICLFWDVLGAQIEVFNVRMMNSYRTIYLRAAAPAADPGRSGKVCSKSNQLNPILTAAAAAAAGGC